MSKEEWTEGSDPADGETMHLLPVGRMLLYGISLGEIRQSAEHRSDKHSEKEHGTH